MATNKYMALVVSVVLAAGVGSLAPACVDNDQSLIIMRMLARDDDCARDTDAERYIGQGAIDLNWTKISQGYVGLPEVHNYLVATGDLDNNQTDTMKIELRRYVMRYEWTRGEELIGKYPTVLAAFEQEDNQYFDPQSGVISAAGSSESPGILYGVAELLPPHLWNALANSGMTAEDAAKIVLGVWVRAQGVTSGGIEMESNEFLFPIALCVGCLTVTCCAGTPEEYVPMCFWGQDMLDYKFPCEC